MLGLGLGACSRPDTRPRDARALRIGSWALATPEDVCAALVNHVKATDGDAGDLTCAEDRLGSAPNPDLPVSIVRVKGASRPLAYLVYAPDEGYRRVLAEYRGEPGMEVTMVIRPSTDWHSGRLVEVTAKWMGTRKALGFTTLTLCLANPSRNDMNFPVCAFTTIVERWRYTSFSQGTDAIPPQGFGPREAWAVAVDKEYGLVLVVQVRGQRDPSVPTGAFPIQPPMW